MQEPLATLQKVAMPEKLRFEVRIEKLYFHGFGTSLMGEQMHGGELERGTDRRAL